MLQSIHHAYGSNSSGFVEVPPLRVLSQPSDGTVVILLYNCNYDYCCLPPQLPATAATTAHTTISASTTSTMAKTTTTTTATMTTTTSNTTTCSGECSCVKWVLKSHIVIPKQTDTVSHTSLVGIVNNTRCPLAETSTQSHEAPELVCEKLTIGCPSLGSLGRALF